MGFVREGETLTGAECRRGKGGYVLPREGNAPMKFKELTGGEVM